MCLGAGLSEIVVRGIGPQPAGLHIRHHQPDHLRAGREETDLRESAQTRRYAKALDEAIERLQIVIEMRGKTIDLALCRTRRFCHALRSVVEPAKVAGFVRDARPSERR